MLVHLLLDNGPGTDAVVRLTAAMSLRECVDVCNDLWIFWEATNPNFQSIDFDPNVFSPYLAPSVTELVKIIGEADTMESKCRITNSLNAIIERAEIRVSHISTPRLLRKVG